jgi:hypothetical protein
MRFTSATQASESSSTTARSLLLGFSMPYSTRSRPDGLEAFVGVLLRAFVIQARFPHGGHDDPVAREIDGVAIRLVHGGHAPPRKRAVQCWSFGCQSPTRSGRLKART